MKKLASVVLVALLATAGIAVAATNVVGATAACAQDVL